jgi:hypothetical protein
MPGGMIGRASRPVPHASPAPLRGLFGRCLALVLMVVLAVQPAAAQSILRDTETEAVLREMSAPLIEAAGLKAGNVDVVVIGILIKRRYWPDVI